MAQYNDLFSDFDERMYLECNPDIRVAVATGVVSSGLEHYRRWGRREQRPGGCSTAVRAAYRPLNIMPPDALRLRVTGSADSQTFEEVGRFICDDILDVVGAYQIDLTTDSQVLDFGCGCGRVLRHFAPQCPAPQIVGVGA